LIEIGWHVQFTENKTLNIPESKRWSWVSTTENNENSIK